MVNMSYLFYKNLHSRYLAYVKSSHNIDWYVHMLTYVQYISTNIIGKVSIYPRLRYK